MRKSNWISALVLSGVLLTACQEPQPAPDFTQRLSTEFTITKMAKNLIAPWSVAELPNGDYLITEKAGKLIQVPPRGVDGVFPERINIKGLPGDIFSGGQGGLLDVVLAPDYGVTNEIYLSYSYGTADSNGTALMRATLNGDTLEKLTIIFRASPPKAAASHFGGKIAFLPDGTLVLTLGDGFAYREDAQKPDTHLGKLVRLTHDGGLPTDNPFIGQDIDGRAFKPQIYSMGHRNVQGLAVDSETGELWEHEHGPRGGDELNLITAGANYGWPIATTGRDYQGARISPFESYKGMVDPIHDWVPSIAPSGLVIYRGEMFPDWNGDALVGGLASRDLRRVDLEKGVSVGEDILLSDLTARIRDVRLARDGAILILVENYDQARKDATTDISRGQLLKLTPK